MFIREKKTSCGNYTEVDIIPRTEEADKATRGKRGKKRKAARPKQNALNDKNAKRYLVQLGNGNFGRGDLHLTLTYKDKTLPGSVEAAEKEVSNYLRRIAYRRGKLGLPPLKYILVTEYKFAKGGEAPKRIHHHIIMNGGMDRDMVEAMWTKTRINWTKYENDLGYRHSIDRIGYANADSIQPDEKSGIEALCRYITKDPQGKKRYSSSRNLDRPETERTDGTAKEDAERALFESTHEETAADDEPKKASEMIYHASRGLNEPMEKCNDFKYSRKRVMELATMPDGGLSEFQRIYKDYEVVEVNPVYYEITGWHIYLKMWQRSKKPKSKAPPKRRRKSQGG